MSTQRTNMKVRIISPKKVEYEDEAEMVVIPGSEGELGTMYGHETMIVGLQSGDVRIYKNGEINKFHVGGGVARISHDAIDILHG